MTTKNEEKIIKLKQEQEKTEKDFQRQLKTIRNKINKLQERISILDKESSKVYSLSRTKHYLYEEKIQKLCRHDKYPVRKRENLRDDASFKYWVSCSNCNADLPHSNT